LKAVQEGKLNYVIAVGVSLKPFQNRRHGKSYASKCHKSHKIKNKNLSHAMLDMRRNIHKNMCVCVYVCVCVCVCVCDIRS